MSAAIIPSGVNRDGTIAVPSLADVQKVGWYEYGAMPGRPGPAILMGHVDTVAGRAVFYRLYQLRRGDRIDVREGGAPLTFSVTSVREVSKGAFPASLFALNGPPVLYLVTCAGAFDYVTRHYEDNIIVTARLLGVPHRPARGPRPRQHVPAGRAQPVVRITCVAGANPSAGRVSSGHIRKGAAPARAVRGSGTFVLICRLAGHPTGSGPWTLSASGTDMGGMLP